MNDADVILANAVNWSFAVQNSLKVHSRKADEL